jgi:hypothetical protein
MIGVGYGEIKAVIGQWCQIDRLYRNQILSRTKRRSVIPHLGRQVIVVLPKGEFHAALRKEDSVHA